MKRLPAERKKKDGQPSHSKRELRNYAETENWSEGKAYLKLSQFSWENLIIWGRRVGLEKRKSEKSKFLLCLTGDRTSLARGSHVPRGG